MQSEVKSDISSRAYSTGVRNTTVLSAAKAKGIMIPKGLLKKKNTGTNMTVHSFLSLSKNFKTLAAHEKQKTTSIERKSLTTA